MALYEFSGVTVRDAQGLPAAGATGTLYDKDDASFSTPLTVTDLNGLPLTLVADQFGQLPDFQIDHDEPRAVWKPSDPTMSTTALLSLDGVVEMGAAAEAAASASAVSAEAAKVEAANTASSVAALDSWVKLGVTRYNRVPNPSFEAGVDGLIFTAGKLTVVQSSFASAVRQGKFGAAVTVGATPDALTSIGQDLGAVTPGTWVAASIPYRATSSASRSRIRFRWEDANGAQVSVTGYSPYQTSSGGAYVSNVFAAQAPEGAASVEVYLYTHGLASDIPDVGAIYHTDAWIAAFATTQEGALAGVATYFDGDTPTTDLKGYNWSGPANASVSQMIDFAALRDEPMAAVEALDAETVKSVNGILPDEDGNVVIPTGTGGGTSDHNQLANLTVGDPHTQYLNEPRGKVLFYTRAEVQTLINNAITAASTEDRKRQNHTGSQPIGSIDGLQAALDGLAGGGGGGGVTFPIALSNVDFSAVGRQLAGAASAASARTAIGAGTSSLALGGTAGAASTAMRSDAILVDPASVPTTGTYFIFRRDVS